VYSEDTSATNVTYAPSTCYASQLKIRYK